MRFKKPPVPSLSKILDKPVGTVAWVDPQWRYDDERDLYKQACKDGYYKKSHWKAHRDRHMTFGYVFIRTAKIFNA